LECEKIRKLEKAYPPQTMESAQTISDAAKSIISDLPYNYPSRSASNIKAVRAAARTYIERQVEKALDYYETKITPKSINGVNCLTVSPKKQLANWKIFYIFGGGFVSGSAYEDLTIAAPISSITGAEIILPEYRLAPEHPWPAASDDTMAVYSELSENCPAILGESAGGNLALVNMLKAKKRGLKLPVAAALISPWCNLTNLGDSMIFNDGRDPTLSLRQSNMAASHYASGQNLINPEISPIFGDYSTPFPNFYISTGTRDLLLSQSIQLASKLRANDISVELNIWEGLWHVFEWNIDLPESILSIRQISDFLTKTVAKSKSC
tara:strand:+ start:1283 stop:2254 length:972 start_codon:yes stop_codon:yes gene_type:complete